MFASAAPASAADLVSNTGKDNTGPNGATEFDNAQAFTTGSDPRGYRLTGVGIALKKDTVANPDPTYTVTIRSNKTSGCAGSTVSGGCPGASLGTLTNHPASLPATNTVAEFTATGGGIDLKPDTTYWMLWDVTSTNSNSGTVFTTTQDGEDAGGAAGWSIANQSLFKAHSDTQWSSLDSIKIAIYGAAIDPPSKVFSERRGVVRHTLAAVAARTVAGALDNIGARLGDAVPAAGLSLAGESMPLGGSGAALPEDAWSGGSRGVTADQLMRTSDFSLALGAAEEDGGPGLREVHLSAWGRGDFGTFEGRPEPGMRYKGETRTGWLGIDARAGRWVAGLAASYGISEADYSFNGGVDPEDRGKLETELSALYPYGRWTFENGLELRGLLGRGSGRLRHRPGGGDAPAETTDLTMWMASTGLRRKLPPVAGIDLSARGDVSLARIKTANGPTEIGGITAHSRRVRASLEASRRFEAGSGRSYTPFLEVAARRDGGDGLTGTGLEMAGGLRHSAPRIHIELRGRWLAAYSQRGTEERGVSATVRMQPRAYGRGPSLSLSPRWGAGTGGARALWRDEMPKAGGAGAASGGNGNGASLDVRTGYGFGVASYGVVTPFAETGLSGGGDSRRLRLGTRFEAAHMRLGVEVAGERRESDAAEPEHRLRLDARLRF